MAFIEHKLICGCFIEVDAYHDWVDDKVGIDDMTILEQCDMHSGKQRIAELEEEVKRLTEKNWDSFDSLMANDRHT